MFRPRLRGALAHIHARPRPPRPGRPELKAPAAAAELLRAAAARPLPSPSAFLAAAAAATAGSCAAQRPPRAGRGTAPGSAPPRQLLAGNNRLGSPGLGFICNVPHISHAHKAGGKGGGAGKRPLPAVPGLGVEATLAPQPGCWEGRQAPPARPAARGALGRRARRRGSSARSASFTDWNKVKLLPFFFPKV